MAKLVPWDPATIDRAIELGMDTDRWTPVISTDDHTGTGTVTQCLAIYASQDDDGDYTHSGYALTLSDGFSGKRTSVMGNADFCNINGGVCWSFHRRAA